MILMMYQTLIHSTPFVTLIGDHKMLQNRLLLTFRTFLLMNLVQYVVIFFSWGVALFFGKLTKRPELAEADVKQR
jgi:hypothetical protein